MLFIANDTELFSAVSSFAWSPFIFDGNKRLASNFKETWFLVYDIDEGMTIDECEVILSREKLCGLVLPSTSHTPEAQRFRVILPLGRVITSEKVYAETWRKGAELFGVVDEQCRDTARFFFSCRTDDGFWLNGDMFVPVIEVEKPKLEQHSTTAMIKVSEDINETVLQIYGEKREKIPEAVDFFLKNAHTGLHGKWNTSLNAFVFSLTLSGVSDTIVLDVCEQLAPQPLDSKDLYQIKRSIKDGKAAL